MAVAVKLEIVAAPATATMTPALQNKLTHIFGNSAHNFSGLLNSFSGNQVNAYNALLSAARKVVQAQNLTGTFDSVKNPIIGTCQRQ